MNIAVRFAHDVLSTEFPKLAGELKAALEIVSNADKTEIKVANIDAL